MGFLPSSKQPRFLCAVVASLLLIQSEAFSFPPVHQRHQCSICTRLQAGFGKDTTPSRPSKKSSSSQELFELQELRAQLETITEKNMLYESLSVEKRAELSKYVTAVVEKAASPIDVTGKRNSMGPMQFVAGIEGKSWRMVFSTDANAGSGEVELPYGSTVVFRVGQLDGAKGTLDYVLKFSKQIMGLKELVAKSSCEVDVRKYLFVLPLIGSINPGLLTFQYQDIKTNIFGMSNLPVGFFGLLKGRVNYVDTIWFDGERWIERNYLENGDVVYSVYVRDIEDESQR
ncbi:hypothetical protein ACHAWO_008009 [Cyclotella atomus]|uniref:Plastid lipid-associated protein/fibrillin conserved domain-containing protein n=1 Tax=Cyclotella atomus TaxID=382360 RepID=A0ABD3PGQ9_9STRA